MPGLDGGVDRLDTRSWSLQPAPQAVGSSQLKAQRV